MTVQGWKHSGKFVWNTAGDLYIRDASQTYSGCKDLNEYLQKQAERNRQVQSVRETHTQPPKKKNGFRL